MKKICTLQGSRRGGGGRASRGRLPRVHANPALVCGAGRAALLAGGAVLSPQGPEGQTGRAWGMWHGRTPRTRSRTCHPQTIPHRPAPGASAGPDSSVRCSTAAQVPAQTGGGGSDGGQGRRLGVERSTLNPERPPSAHGSRRHPCHVRPHLVQRRHGSAIHGAVHRGIAIVLRSRHMHDEGPSARGWWWWWVVGVAVGVGVGVVGGPLVAGRGVALLEESAGGQRQQQRRSALGAVLQASRRCSQP